MTGGRNFLLLDLVWKIEGKIAKFSTTTFTWRSSFYLFYGMGAQKT
jgi:hypothetical protein